MTHLTTHRAAESLILVSDSPVIDGMVALGGGSSIQTGIPQPKYSNCARSVLRPMRGIRQWMTRTQRLVTKPASLDRPLGFPSA